MDCLQMSPNIAAVREASILQNTLKKKLMQALHLPASSYKQRMACQREKKNALFVKQNFDF